MRDRLGVPFLLAMAFAFLACGSTVEVGKAGEDGGAMGPLGAAPPGILACVRDGAGGPNNCTCTAASAKAGACSPQLLGQASHCCATVDGTGATTLCQCAADPSCKKYSPSSGPECICTTTQLGINGTATPDCPKPAGGHCCRSQARADCGCQMDVCGGDTVDVDSCSPANSVLRCLSPAIAVTSCQ